MFESDMADSTYVWPRERVGIWSLINRIYNWCDLFLDRLIVLMVCLRVSRASENERRHSHALEKTSKPTRTVIVSTPDS